MKAKILTLLSFILFSQIAFAQKFKVNFIPKNDSVYKKEKRDFIYLNDSLDLSKVKHIGQIKAQGNDYSVLKNFFLIKLEAQKRGGNAFKFVNFTNENNQNELVLDIFIINEEMIRFNEDLFPKNKVYLFGKPNNIEEFKLNDEAKKINPLHYLIIDLDKKMKINKGGFMGTTLFLSPQQNQNSVYINFSGFGLSGVAPTGFGVSFTAGRVSQMDKHLALLLTHIFKPE